MISCLLFNFFAYLGTRLSPDGGIGRRAGLKHQWGNPSRFEPGSGYSEGRIVQSALQFKTNEGLVNLNAMNATLTIKPLYI